MARSGSDNSSSRWTRRNMSGLRKWARSWDTQGFPSVRVVPLTNRHYYHFHVSYNKTDSEAVALDLQICSPLPFVVNYATSPWDKYLRCSGVFCLFPPFNGKGGIYCWKMIYMLKSRFLRTLGRELWPTQIVNVQQKWRETRKNRIKNPAISPFVTLGQNCWCILHSINEDRLVFLLLDSFLIGLGLGNGKGFPPCLISSLGETIFCGSLRGLCGYIRMLVPRGSWVAQLSVWL